MGAEAVRDASGRQWLLGLMLVVALVVPLVPLALVQVPPIVDYPNHLARLWLIAGGAAEPPMDAIYAVDWSRAVTNIGVDLLALVLGPLIGGEAVARGALALSLLVPAIGAVVLARAVAGRLHVLQLTLPLATWNVCTTFGFLNHQIAVGLAMLAAAAEPVLARRPLPWAMVLRAAIALAISVVHPFGAIAYAGLVGAWALGDAPLSRARFLQAILRAGLAVLPVALFLLMAPVPPGAEQGAAVTHQPAWLPWLSKVTTFTWPFVTHWPLQEAVAGVLGLVVLAAMARVGAVRVHRGFFLAGVTLAVLALLGPGNVGDTSLVDIRIACLALPVLCVALRPSDASRRWWLPVGVALCLLMVVRGASVTQFWLANRQNITAVHAALAELPEGAALLPTRIVPETFSWTDASQSILFLDFAQFNVALLAVPERRAFVPMLFSAAGKQPIRVLPPSNEIAVPDGPQPRVQQLLSGRPHPQFPYLRDWRSRFDHVLLLNAQGNGPGMPPGLTLLRDAGFAQLWRIDRADE